MDDSTQEFRSPYAAHATFLFTDTTPRGIEVTMRSLGAYPKSSPDSGWLFPAGARPLLDFRLIEDVEDHAIDLVWDSWKWYVPLLEALGVEERTR